MYYPFLISFILHVTIIPYLSENINVSVSEPCAVRLYFFIDWIKPRIWHPAVTGAVIPEKLPPYSEYAFHAIRTSVIKQILAVKSHDPDHAPDRMRRTSRSAPAVLARNSCLPVPDEAGDHDPLLSHFFMQGAGRTTGQKRSA